MKSQVKGYDIRFVLVTSHKGSFKNYVAPGGVHAYALRSAMWGREGVRNSAA